MPSKELIEQVAKELERNDCREYGWTYEQFDIWWHHDPLNRNHHRQTLRAQAAISTILAALQEPTERMRKRGLWYSDDPEKAWSAMLARSPLGEQSE